MKEIFRELLALIVIPAVVITFVIFCYGTIFFSLYLLGKAVIKMFGWVFL